MSGAFYWAIECPHCDETSHHGINVTTLEHNGLPAIPLDLGAATTYDCEHCGQQLAVGPLDVWPVDSL